MSGNHLNVTTGLVATGLPLALHGYDAVSYHGAGPVRGAAANSVVHDGATYYFASPDNAATFSAKPDAYLPSYGGFCAYGASIGKKFDGDPTMYDVVDGRLHLNLNPAIQAAFRKDMAGAIVKADAAWSGIANQPAASL